MSADHGSSYARAWTIARTDLRQLRQARDFWMPLMIIASMFVVIIPGMLLLLITRLSHIELATQLSDVVVGRQQLSAFDQAVKDWQEHGGNQIRRESSRRIAASS